MKSLVELNSFFLTFFCYISWFDETQHQTPCKRGLYVESYCFLEIIASQFKINKLRWIPLFSLNKFGKLSRTRIVPVYCVNKSYSNPQSGLQFLKNFFIVQSVRNFQSIKSPVELNSLLIKLFCYVTQFDERQNWRPCKRGLFFKSYCFFKIIAQRFKNYKLQWSYAYFSLL